MRPGKPPKKRIVDRKDPSLFSINQIMLETRRKLREGKIVSLCSNCGAIKVDKKDFVRIGRYREEERRNQAILHKASNESKGSLSHSICGRCAKELYPELD